MQLGGTASGLEILRVFIGAIAVWFTLQALARAWRYHRHRDALADDQLAADWLIIDLRIEGAVFHAALFVFLTGCLAALQPPPMGHGPYNLISVTSNFLALFLAFHIVATKIANRHNRARIYRIIEQMTQEKARSITRDERHALKNELQRAESHIYFLTTLLIRTGMSREAVAEAVQAENERRERLMRGDV